MSDDCIYSTLWVDKIETRAADRTAPAATMTASTPPNLARIPGSDFLMGAADAEEDERPVHRVFVSEFFIGRFPVTHDEYARFVRATGILRPRSVDLPLIARGGRDGLFRELASALRLGRGTIRHPAEAAIRSCSFDMTMRWPTADGCPTRSAV